MDQTSIQTVKNQDNSWMYASPNFQLLDHSPVKKQTTMVKIKTVESENIVNSVRRMVRERKSAFLWKKQ
jgi:hypothetical protein